MTCVIDVPKVFIGDGLEVDLVSELGGEDIRDPAPPVITGSVDNDDEEEELDIEEFDDEDFDDDFDDDFEDEDEGEYDVVEEFEDDFTFVDPATKKPVTHSKDVGDNKKTDDAKGNDDDGATDDVAKGEDEASDETADNQ